ncbi:complex I assembly factor ACAD9, mitochondrial-like [Amphiura filiformis]|uniref:complex I assembly factor ACAD9, mitochondrial-like n=1 Tax=Amphiura filiformis TaxID=82378 RepID=UPI003B217A86
MLRRNVLLFSKRNRNFNVRTLSFNTQNTKVKAKGNKHRHGILTADRGHGRRIRQVSTSITHETAFVKNLFIGKFNNDEVFPYPEITSEEFNDLNQMIEPIEKFFTEEVDSKAIDVNAEIDQKTLQGLKDLGLFGQQVPEQYGGLELSNTGYTRISEVTALDSSVAYTLSVHQSTGLKGLLTAGTDDQKAKYLPKLATGEHIAAFCLTEPSSGSDVASIETKATLSSNSEHYLLNGTKVWVTNGGIADIFIVFAQIEVTNEEGEKEDKLTAFIVDKSFGNIICGPSEDKLGIRGTNTCKVTFQDTPVPVENVLGEVGGGFKLAMNLLNSGRLNMGSSGAGVLKKLIGTIVEHAKSRKQFNTKLSDFPLIQEKIAKLTMKIYAMESMSYLTAGILDRSGDLDCSLEAAIVKVYSSESCWECISDALQVMGGLGYMKDYPHERCLRDSKIMSIVEGTNEVLRMYVALTGLKYTGNVLGTDIYKVPVMAKMISNKRMAQFVGIDKWVHADLKENAKQLDEMCSRFQVCIVQGIHRYKKDIINEQLLLNRYTNMAVSLYSVTACLSRASRSKVLGLPNCDHEILLTKAICDQAYGNFLDLFDDILWDPDDNNDRTIQKIGRDICNYRRYKAEHPLTKFWT